MTTGTFLRMTAAALIGVTLLPVNASAQGAQSGLTGVVRDEAGAVMPGVTVEAESPALIERVRSVVTDGQGAYRIIDLRPGLYTVTFSLPGFRTVRREGVNLGADFTATINADMPIGAVEETVQVTGEASLVDTQRTELRTVYTNEVQEGLPTNRLIQSLAQYVPGVVGGMNIDGPASRTLSIYGSPSGETNSAIDGMSDRRGSNGGVSVTFYMNQGSVQEVSVQTGGGNAEAQYAGVWMNAIPKEGGNTFHGSILGYFSNEGLTGDNLSAEYIARGLTSVNSLKKTWDFNPNIGGPLIQDKLWFHTAYRNNQIDKYVAGSYYNVDPLAWHYVPDFSRPTVDRQIHRNYAFRLTWQATPRNKINVSYEKDRRITTWRRAVGGNVAPEATTYTPFYPNALTTVVWRVPVTNRLLLDTGFMSYEQDWDERRQIDPAVGFDVISVTEASTGQIYRASTVYGHNYDNPLTFRSSATYVTGSHSYKAGFSLRHRGNGPTWNTQSRNGDMNYTFRNGVPSQITLFAQPLEQRNDVNADLGVYAQDSWTLRRLTFNYGVRFDYLNASVPEQHLPAGRFVPERNFAAVKNVPNWKDINPRLAVAYDVFGTARTVFKASVGRYITGGSLASQNNPVNTSINSANRSWRDDNGNYSPDCDFAVPTANGECGPLSNLNFGKVNPGATQYDPDVLIGWGKRPYAWVGTVGVQRQFTDGLAGEVTYAFRREGNFTVTDNLEVTPEDYDPYCITAPNNDSRLPVAGQQLCGYYDVSPLKRGRVQNFVTFAEHFGNQTQRYNGVDLSANFRRAGVTLFGGVNIGRLATDDCFIVDSPQQLLHCEVTPPFLANYKAYAVYNLPWWGVQVSGTFQAVPVPSSGGMHQSILATYVATNREIAPSLGRNLASGVNGTATVELLEPFALHGGHAKQLDLRLGKVFPVGGTNRLRLSLDIYNLFNSNDIQTLNTRLSSNNAINQWQRPLSILSPRYLQIGTEFSF